MHRPTSVSPYTSWLAKVSESDVILAPLGSGAVVTVDTGGYVRLWETASDTLQRSLMEWRNMIGAEDGRPVQVLLKRPEETRLEGKAECKKKKIHPAAVHFLSHTGAVLL